MGMKTWKLALLFRMRLRNCGVVEDDDPLPAIVCDRLREATDVDDKRQILKCLMQHRLVPRQEVLAPLLLESLRDRDMGMRWAAVQYLQSLSPEPLCMLCINDVW